MSVSVEKGAVMLGGRVTIKLCPNDMDLPGAVFQANPAGLMMTGVKVAVLRYPDGSEWLRAVSSPYRGMHYGQVFSCHLNDVESVHQGHDGEEPVCLDELPRIARQCSVDDDLGLVL